MNFDPTRRCLESHGYTVKFREAGWVECLVSLDHERWCGSGDSETAALEHAVSMMFPSRAARSLFESSLAPSDTAVPSPRGARRGAR